MKQEKICFDIFDKELRLNDLVAAAGETRGELTICRIIGIHPIMVRVAPVVNAKKNPLRLPRHLIKLESKDAMLYILKNSK